VRVKVGNVQVGFQEGRRRKPKAKTKKKKNQRCSRKKGFLCMEKKDPGK